jgi:hypothetical protein
VGTQPGVFTDHIQKFGQFADLKVLAPLDGERPDQDQLPDRPDPLPVKGRIS